MNSYQQRHHYLTERRPEDRTFIMDLSLKRVNLHILTHGCFLMVIDFDKIWAGTFNGKGRETIILDLSKFGLKQGLEFDQ